MARTTTPPTKSLRALVLDPDAASLRSLVRSLEARSFSVVTASDGTRGTGLLLDELLSLDVLVVDAGLPDRDGRGFAELVRRAGGESDLALVVVAREASPELKASLLALGVDAVIERSEGSELAAAAAVAAIAARAPRTDDLELEDPPARRSAEPVAVPSPFDLSLARGWSLLAA